MSRIKSVKALSTTVAAVLAVVALVVGLGIGALALGGLAGAREVTVTRTVVSTVTQTGAGTTVTVTGAGTTVTVTQTATVTAPGQTPFSRLKVLLILPIDEKDNSWNRAAFDAVMKLKDLYGFELSIERNLFDGTKAEPYAVDYARKGYNIIIGQGIQYMVMFHKIAPQFPNTMFLCVDCAPSLVGAFEPGAKVAPNVYNIWMTLGEGGFLMGYIAGKMTKSNKIGIVGGGRVPSIWEGHEAFKLGVKTANPNAEVLEAYMPLSWADVAGAKKAAQSMVAAGADIVSASGNGIDVGVTEAALESGVWTSTVYADLPALRPDIQKLMGSIVFRWDIVFDAAIKDYIRGTWKNGFLTATMASGIVTVSLGKNVPDNVKAEVMSLYEKILSGTLKITFDYTCFDNPDKPECKPTAAIAHGL
jgi:basic membrane protein A